MPGIFQMTLATLRSAAKRSIKHLIIRTGLESVALLDAGRFAPSAAGRGMIFTLHHVRPDRGYSYEPNGHLSVTPEFLDQAIKVARECGLHPVDLEDLPGLLADPTDTRKFMCFTLDDGYRDNAKYAAPVFRKHGVPYTIFITTGFVERNRTMWWETAEQLTRKASSFDFDFGQRFGYGIESVACSSHHEKLLAFERLVDFVENVDEDDAVARIDLAAKAASVDATEIVDQEIMTVAELQNLVSDSLARLGAHTISHPNLTRVSFDRLKQELENSAAGVAEYCGRRPKAVAYPYGGRNAVGLRETEAATAAGFIVGVTTQASVLSSKSLERPTELARVSLNGCHQKSRYVRALASGLPFGLMSSLTNRKLPH